MSLSLENVILYKEERTCPSFTHSVHSKGKEMENTGRASEEKFETSMNISVMLSLGP
jgi:hypothetical protein